jgi:hypothetical protein
MSFTMRLLKAFVMLPSQSPRTLAAAVGISLLALAPEHLQSQSPEERIELERFRDSVGATRDSVGLLALERKMIDSAKADRSNGCIYDRRKRPRGASCPRPCGAGSR